MATETENTNPLANYNDYAGADETTETIQDDADNGVDEETLEDGTEGEKESEEPTDDEALIEDEKEEESNPLSLSEEVAKALPPDARKRYEQHVAGVVKREQKVAEDETVLGNYREWDKALNTKETATPALRHLVESVSKAHGIDVADVFPQAEAKAERGEDDPENLDFEYETDQKVYAMAKADAVREMEDRWKKAGISPEDVAKFIQSQKSGDQKAKADESRSREADDKLQRVINTLKATFDGWTPDRAKVRAAMIAGDLAKPIQTVKTALVDDLLEHTRKRSSKNAGPEALRGGKAPGKTLSDDPMQTSARDYITG